ncbi:MAG: hypothetical protein HKL89_04925 [Candidatus Dormibacteraeota bacterium]|nr:hypothetical protein [Candidatus Dormibacteraeota bacterium]
MCEILLAVWPEPSPIEQVLEWGTALERYGLGGFGWGVAWRGPKGVASYRHPGQLAGDDAGRARLASIRSTHFLVHLRRPSQLTTIALADTQPFRAEDGSFAFAHNGRLDGAEGLRGRFGTKLQGRADSEVGFRLFEELLGEGQSARAALPAIHTRLGGTANLAFLPAEGAPLVYAGAPANQLWSFDLAGAEVVSTGLHSTDEAVFEFCFPGASHRARIGDGETAAVAES